MGNPSGSKYSRATREMAETIERMNETICSLKAANIMQSKEIAVQVRHNEATHEELVRMRKIYNELEDAHVELEEEYKRKVADLKAEELTVGRLTAMLHDGSDRARELSSELDMKDSICRAQDDTIKEQTKRIEQLSTELKDCASKMDVNHDETDIIRSKLDATAAELREMKRVVAHSERFAQMWMRRAQEAEKYKQFHQMLKDIFER